MTVRIKWRVCFRLRDLLAKAHNLLAFYIECGYTVEFNYMSTLAATLSDALHLAVVERFEGNTDFIANAAELAPDKLIRSGGVRRIVEANMPAIFYRTGKGRAALVGSSANGNHVIPLLVQIQIDRIRGVVTNIDTNLLHHDHCLFVERARSLGSCRTNGKVTIK